MPVETEHAWAAGIVDGEGCISITMQKPGVNGRKTPGFQVRISVRMTCERTIRRLYELYGGTFKVALSRKPDRHRNTYEWFISDSKCLETVGYLFPYLVTKQDQAELVIRYYDECCPKGHRGRGHPCSQELVDARTVFFERMRDLNKRGVN